MQEFVIHVFRGKCRNLCLEIKLYLPIRLRTFIFFTYCLEGENKNQEINKNLMKFISNSYLQYTYIKNDELHRSTTNDCFSPFIQNI